ncbi:MAG: 4-hydroxy-tetrahydrodipicolinate synthase [Prolixibacteraceae bacterium]|nr:4-hydroxy-tetrahydrodipicolinate synthase [Prolixibacteraceae bacterium]
MSQLFTGAGVALVTPFTESEEIDYKALETIIDNQISGGTDYLVALGTTAETPTLSATERLNVVDLVKGKSAGLPVVVGLGGNDTRSVVNQIDKFNFEGVSGILVVTPFYNKPSQEGMFRHYSEIAKASPVPIILYNVPSRTGVNLEAETVIRLANANDKIVAVKEASGILSQITKIVKYTPDNFTLISGDDVLALPIISIGGKGVISVVANALPGKLSEMIHLALDEKYRKARELNFELIDILKLIFKEGNPAGIKALMNIQGTIENSLRSPLYKISDATYREIEEAFNKIESGI